MGKVFWAAVGGGGIDAGGAIVKLAHVIVTGKQRGPVQVKLLGEAFSLISYANRDPYSNNLTSPFSTRGTPAFPVRRHSEVVK